MIKIKERYFKIIIFCFFAVLLIIMIALIANLSVSASTNEESTNEESTEEETTNEESTEEELQDEFIYGLNPERDYLILVNDEHEYVFGGTYDQLLQQDLIYVTDFQGDATAIEKGANAAFSMLKHQLFGEDIYIELYSGYRTEDAQQWVYDYYSNLEGWSETNHIAKPGFSEHHTGLLLNIVIWWPKIEAWATETPERTAEDPEFFAKIHNTLADYGFIDRYPEGKEDVTGYPAEPYEIRFVGSSKVAHEIMDNGLTLEEYLNS